jgi:hypothetical protein
LGFLDIFSKTPPVSNSTEIRPVRAAQPGSIDRPASNDDFYTWNVAALRVEDRGSIYGTSKEEKCFI